MRMSSVGSNGVSGSRSLIISLFSFTIKLVQMNPTRRSFILASKASTSSIGSGKRPMRRSQYMSMITGMWIFEQERRLASALLRRLCKAEMSLKPGIIKSKKRNYRKWPPLRRQYPEESFRQERICQSKNRISACPPDASPKKLDLTRQERKDSTR